MIECSGKVLSGVGERVTGRLRRVAEMRADRSREAKILLWDGASDISEALNDTAVGVVVMGAECRLAGGCGLPIFRLADDMCDTELLLADKIAILDCQRQKLCVDPDIDVIKRYFGRLAALPESKIPWICTDSYDIAGGCDGVLVRVRGDEEEVYDLLCNIADRNTGARIVAQTAFDGDVVRRIRGVLRAAVWGRISLICQVNTPDEAQQFFSLTHTAFCALESEGREFNGFIPKGIRVDTPITLLSAPNRYSDIFVLDCNSLLKRFTASENTDNASRQVLSYISEFIRQVGDAKVSLCVHGDVAPYTLEHFKGEGQLNEVYTDMRTAKSLERWL